MRAPNWKVCAQVPSGVGAACLAIHRRLKALERLLVYTMGCEHCTHMDWEQFPTVSMQFL